MVSETIFMNGILNVLPAFRSKVWLLVIPLAFLVLAAIILAFIFGIPGLRVSFDLTIAFHSQINLATPIGASKSVVATAADVAAAATATVDIVDAAADNYNHDAGHDDDDDNDDDNDDNDKRAAN